MMSRNSHYDHRNQTKGHAQGPGIYRGNHSGFISILEGMVMSTVLPWALITGPIFLQHKCKTQLCAAAARAQRMKSVTLLRLL